MHVILSSAFSSRCVKTRTFRPVVGCPTTFPNKSKMADGGHIEFRNMLIVNIPVLHEHIYIKFGTKMQHGYTLMPT